jgi:hypothetical protein
MQVGTCHGTTGGQAVPICIETVGDDWAQPGPYAVGVEVTLTIRASAAVQEVQPS